MIRGLIVSVGLTSLLVLGGGCVEQTRYDALEARLKDRDAQATRAEEDSAEQRRRIAILEAEKLAKEKEVALLQARLEGRAIEASLRPGEAGTVAAGAPPEARAEGAGAAFAVEGLRSNPRTGGAVIDGGLLFAPGSATIRTAAEPVLARVLEAIERPEHAERDVRIEGHTDDQPIQKSKFHDNWELSGARAYAVLRWFEERGVPAARLSFAGFGAGRPFAVSGKDARAQNRRVEVLLLERR
jgi:flagellar motor protein MotB